MTGFLESEFTSATGLYAQLIPTIFSSLAHAAATSSARSGEPVAASAMAPGLNRNQHKNFRRSLVVGCREAYNCVPAVGELKADTRPE